MQEPELLKATDGLYDAMRPILANYVASLRDRATPDEVRTIATIAAAHLLADAYSLTGTRELTPREHQELMNTLIGVCRMWESAHPPTETN